MLDLLFHPLETRFTLLELESGPLRRAALRPIGIFFMDVNADLKARRSFRERYGTEVDPHMVDLGRWHALEEQDPDLFGRMHWLFLEQGNRIASSPAAATRAVAEPRPDGSAVRLQKRSFSPQSSNTRS